VRKRGTSLVLVVLLIGAGGYLLKRHRAGGREPIAASSAPAAPVVSRAVPTFRTQPAATARQPDLQAAMDAVLAKGGPGIDPGPGRKYMEKYDGRSGRLNKAQPPSDPTYELNAEGDLAVSAWITPSPAQIGVPLVLHARVRARDSRQAPTITSVHATFISEKDARVIATTPLTPTAGPRPELTATFVPEVSLLNEEEGSATAPAPGGVTAQVVVEGTLAGKPFHRSLETSVMVHQLEARIVEQSLVVTRNAHDVLLRFDTEIGRPGNYYAEAELWSTGPSARPIAFGRLRSDGLARGPHHWELMFGGLILRDTGIDGPYVIKRLVLMQVDTDPPHQSQPIAVVRETPRWTAASFPL
jgi:hypothetical protein